MQPVNVYEVVRVINSAPLFLNEHHERFVNSIQFLNAKAVCEKDFSDEICNAIKTFEIQNGNLRIDTLISQDSIKYELSIKQLKHNYPQASLYQNGVKTCLYQHERPNPEKKIWDSEIRQKIDTILSTTDFYEVLYYNENRILTEGSRSNLFFILDNKLFTPKTGDVLPGITRLKILELAKQIGIDLQEIDINIDELNKFDVAFISGTSPKILPLNSIENTNYDVNNKLLRKLILDFDTVIQKDIDRFKSCS